MDVTKRVLCLTILAVIGLTPAACGGGDGSDIVVIGPDEPVRIRTLLSHDEAWPTGDAARVGVEMAVRDFHRVHGHEIELGPPLDSMCSPEGGRIGAERIVAEGDILGVVGTSCSAAAVAASPVFSAAGIVMISPSNTSPVLTSDLRGNAGSDHHPGYFRISHNDLYQGQAVAGFAYSELGLRRVATMHDGDPYTTALAGAFADAFTGHGGVIAAVGVIEKGQTDMGEVLAELAVARPDGVFFPLFEREAVPFIRQLRGYDGLEGVTLISGDGAFGPEFLALPQAEGVYFAGPEPHVGARLNRATGRTAAEVLAEFEASHGELAQTTPYWAHAYDAAALLLAAIQRAAVRDDGNTLTRFLGIDEHGVLRINRSELRHAVQSASSDFTGLTGMLSCDEFGDCAEGIQVIYHHPDASVTDPGALPVVHRFVP